MRILKPKIPVTAYYTGDNGTYCSVLPTQTTQTWLTQVCDKARWMGFNFTTSVNQHVTVVHSKKGLTIPQQQRVWASGFNASRRFTAQPIHFIHWPGHDKEGYVVLEMESPELAQVNAWLRKTFDLPVTFDEYRAHLTVVENAYSNSVDYAQKLCDELNKLTRPEYLMFTGLRMEDLK